MGCSPLAHVVVFAASQEAKTHKWTVISMLSSPLSLTKQANNMRTHALLTLAVVFLCLEPQFVFFQSNQNWCLGIVIGSFASTEFPKLKVRSAEREQVLQQAR